MLQNGFFLIISIWYNVNIQTVLNKEIVGEPLYCGLFLVKVYIRLNENEHNISLKIVYERI